MLKPSLLSFLNLRAMAGGTRVGEFYDKFQRKTDEHDRDLK